MPGQLRKIAHGQAGSPKPVVEGWQWLYPVPLARSLLPLSSDPEALAAPALAPWLAWGKEGGREGGCGWVHLAELVNYDWSCAHQILWFIFHVRDNCFRTMSAVKLTWVPQVWQPA